MHAAQTLDCLSGRQLLPAVSPSGCTSASAPQHTCQSSALAVGCSLAWAARLLPGSLVSLSSTRSHSASPVAAASAAGPDVGNSAASGAGSAAAVPDVLQGRAWLAAAG